MERRNGVEEVELLPAPPFRDDEPGLLELLQVLHHAERVIRSAFECAQRLSVLPEQLVEQVRRVGSASALNTSSMGSTSTWAE